MRSERGQTERQITETVEYEKKVCGKTVGERGTREKSLPGDGSNALRNKSNFARAPNQLKYIQKAFANREKHTISFSNGE